MLYEEFSKLTRGLATYEQFKKIEAIYNDSGISKREAATLWYLSYGRNMPPLLNTLEQKVDYVRRMTEVEKNRIFWAVYEAETGVHFDKKTRTNFTLMVGNPVKNSESYHYLHLALYHELDVGSGTITVIPTGWRSYGNVAPCWRGIRDKIFVKVKP